MPIEGLEIGNWELGIGEPARSWGASAVLGFPQVEHLAWFPP
ncbi:hypothetical protein NIES4103_68080 [Nostoc sp. NIES-4103]|nr:hypothetical protein NIES4103_68080 [Nostoc sp. NIES-4103]